PAPVAATAWRLIVSNGRRPTPIENRSEHCGQRPSRASLVLAGTPWRGAVLPSRSRGRESARRSVASALAAARALRAATRQRRCQEEQQIRAVSLPRQGSAQGIIQLTLARR